MVVGVTCFGVAFNSSVITARLEGPRETFHVSTEVALLPITVFVVGALWTEDRLRVDSCGSMYFRHSPSSRAEHGNIDRVPTY